jgi:hypothetical protein
MFILGIGLYSLSNTQYDLTLLPEDQQTQGFNTLDLTKHVPLFNYNIGPLGGVLGLGFHLHALTIPVLRKYSEEKHWERDISVAFFFVFITYCVLGIAGLYGFLGN